MKKQLRLWTCFWGEKHLNLFENALVKSLMWPLNKAAIESATWDLWVPRADFATVMDIAKNVGVEVELHDADPFLSALTSSYYNDAGYMVLQMFKKSAERCFNSGSQMLIAPPDTIFSDESIFNILEAGDQTDVVVFVAHMRVHPTIINDIEVSNIGNRFGPNGAVTSPRLVTLAMRNAHKSWTEAEFGHERINTHVGGIMWKRRSNDVYAVQHMLPTPYLINWTKEDVEFFSAPYPTVFGCIDHTWPGALVLPQERMRLLGSSDDAFIVEITEPKDNIPPLENYDMGNPDKFWRGAFHNKMNKQFVVTFRGE